MKKLLLPAALLMMTPMAATAQNKVETQPYENYIQVTGKAEKEVVPDEIYVKIVLNENSPIKKMDIDKQEAEMIKALKSLGLDTEKKLSVTNLEGSHKTYVLKKNQGTVVKTYQLKLGDASALANVYRKMDDIKISDVSVIRVYHSKMKELGNELKIEAVKDAQSQAIVLAQAVGQKAGRAVMISEYGYMGIEGVGIADNMYMRTKSIAASADGSSDDTAIEFRKLKLTYSVQVKFVLD